MEAIIFLSIIIALFSIFISYANCNNKLDTPW